jgi:AraC-like DNA-binding protein/mannose-6-phosphate isomerase-like protein (cupin superfamily)
MSSDVRTHPLRHAADHADIVSLHTASGAEIELMRTWYRTQVFPRHTHDYFTLGVMLHGVGTLWYRGADRTTQRGDVVVIPPGEVHTGGLGRGTGILSYLAVHLPPDVLAAAAAAQGIRGGRAPDFASVIIHDPAVGAALRRLDAVMRTAHDTNAAVPARDGEPVERMDDGAADDALSAAIGLLVRRHARPVSSASDTPPSPTREPNLVRIAREIIEDCYAENAQTSLRALARRAGVTPFHLVRIFTQTLGLSPHRYLVQTRIRRASEFLARGVPSSFVAAMTGFVDQSHLTTQFKRYVGTTPASYQRCVGPSAHAETARRAAEY